MRVLSHICCGPCFTVVHQSLGQDGHDLTAFYYNPNIHPAQEYELRLAQVQRYCELKAIPVVVGDHDAQAYHSAVAGYEDKPRRCKRCYKLRLERTAELAALDGYDAFTTSLFLSPYQYHDELKEVAAHLSHDYSVKCLYQDWRPAYRQSIELSKSFDMYRQKYCGCSFSEAERRDKLAGR